MTTTLPTSARVASSTEAAVYAQFSVYPRSRSYAESTIRLHEKRLSFFLKRAARSGRHLGDLDQRSLLDLLKGLRTSEKVLCRGFLRVWIRYRNPPAQ